MYRIYNFVRLLKRVSRNARLTKKILISYKGTL